MRNPISDIRNPKRESFVGSADFQSAVSRVSNPLTARNVKGGSDSLPTGSRRYSRLETYATSMLPKRDQPFISDFGFRISTQESFHG